MEKSEFGAFCRSHGLTCVSDIKAAGTVRDSLVTLLWGGKKRLTVLLPAGDGQRKQYSADLKLALRERSGNAMSAAWGDGFVGIYISLKKIDDPWSQGVLSALEALRSTGFTVPDACDICGLSGCDMAVPRKGVAFAPVHGSCLDGSVQAVREKAQLNAKNGSYFLGFIGALLGMLVGIIPSLFTIIALQRIYVFLFMLIPLCVYAGYKLLRGKMNYTALALSVLLSVVGLFAIFYIWLIYELIHEGIPAGMVLDLLGLMDQKELLLDMIRTEDFIKCAIFVVVGIALAWSQISRTSKHDIRDAVGVLSTAIRLTDPEDAGSSDFRQEE